MFCVSAQIPLYTMGGIDAGEMFYFRKTYYDIMFGIKMVMELAIKTNRHFRHGSS